MIKIRLSRLGKKNDPFYRIVAIEESQKREGKFLEILGFWHPKGKLLSVKKDGIKKWRSTGAQISKAVERLMNS